MIKYVFSSQIRFSIVFLIILLVDVYIKTHSDNLDYRYLSKPLVLISLIAFYYFNKRHKKEEVEKNVLLALGAFLLGGVMILNYSNKYFLLLGMIFFAVGKVFFCLKFKSKEDFEFSKLFPFALIIYVFITFVISMVYKNLKAFFVPSLISLFISLVMLNLAYLRKTEFSKLSYLFVLIGCVLFVTVEGINAINTFNKSLPFPAFLVMLFYGISMYLIVLGIVNEKENKVVKE